MNDKRNERKDQPSQESYNNEQQRHPADYSERVLSEDHVKGNVVRNTLPPPPPPKGK